MAHGSPMLAVEDNQYTWLLRDLGSRMKPEAILLFSAHWESKTQLVSGVERYETIHDFGGFPDFLYQIQYPAVGQASVTERVVRLLAEAGLNCAVDRQRGLDHGAWVVLRILFPAADIPVIGMSVNPFTSPAEQYRIGKALASLRADDILIVGSGGTVHNFSTMRWRADDGEADAWAVAFDDWVLARAKAWDLESLFNYVSLAPNARMAVPVHGEEHFIPVFYAMGAADDQRVVQELHRSYQYGNLSHTVWQFGE